MLIFLLASLIIRGLVYDGPPPFRYQKDATIKTAFVTNLSRYCGKPPQGHRWGGCYKGGFMFVENPCSVTGDYAKEMCHELGHAEGWSRYHEF